MMHTLLVSLTLANFALLVLKTPAELVIILVYYRTVSTTPVRHDLTYAYDPDNACIAGLIDTGEVHSIPSLF
jgi:hypothetical protein